MSLNTTNGISYAIRGDNSALRRALQESAAATRSFGQTMESAIVGPAQRVVQAEGQVAQSAAQAAAAMRAQGEAALDSLGSIARSTAASSAAMARQAAAASTASTATAAAARVTAASGEVAATSLSLTAVAAASASGATTTLAGASRAASIALSQSASAGSAAAASNASVAATSGAAASSLTAQAAAAGSAATAARATAASTSAVVGSLSAQAAAASTSAAATSTLGGAAQSTRTSLASMGTAGTASLSSVAGMLQHLVGPLGFGALIALVAKTGVGFNDFIARQEIAFETMLGSASASKEFLSDMLAFAKTTPFSFPELTASAQKMVAFGIESDKVVDILQTLGDATVGSGGSMAELSGLGIVLGQVSAKGRLMGQELLQFAERGIPALTVLANKAGMSVADFQEEVSKGNVRSEEAITNLIDGLRDGTEGINGTTAAYGGLMEKIKESNIFSSAFDSFKSGFRNMSAALTESITPGLVALVNIGGDAMGVITGIAKGFNGLPGPLRNAALALGLVLIAGRLLGPVLTRQVGSGLTAMRTGFTNARASIDSTTTGLNRMQVATRMSSIGIRNVGGALVGAFGGPVAFAVTAGIGLVTTLLAMQSQTSAQAKANADALRGTLDETTGAITAQTEAEIKRQLTTDRAYGGSVLGFFKDTGNAADDARKMGLAVDDLYAAMEGDPAKLDSTRQFLNDYIKAVEDGRWDGDFKNAGAARQILVELDTQEKTLRSAKAAAESKQEIDEKQVQTAYEKADAYRQVTYAMHSFSEEQQKVIDGAGDAAGKAFDSAFSLIGTFKPVVVTDDELADARDKVTDSTNALRDAEDAREKAQDRKKHTTNERLKASDAVTRALRNQQDALGELADLEAADIPIADQMAKHYEDTLAEAQQFSEDIEGVLKAGLDPNLVNDLILAGPEEAAPQFEAFLSENGANLIALANQTEDTLNGLNARVIENARLTAIAMQSPLSSTASDLPIAMQISNTGGSKAAPKTDEEIAALIGVSAEDVKRVAALYGQDWVITMQEQTSNRQASVSGGKNADGSPKMGGYYGPDEWIGDWPTEEVVTSEWAQRVTDAMSVLVRPTITVEPAWALPNLTSKSVLAPNGLPGPYLGGHYNGGIIPGYTPGRDTGFIGIGGGESVMRPEWTRGVGPGFVHRMNRLARTGGVSAVREAMAGFQGGHQGAFRNGGIVGQGSYAPPPQVIEVPVTQRVEHHGVQTFGDIYAADASDFERQARQARRRSFTGGRR